ncbi:MAG: Ig-like domain-containing protein [Candidatus Marinimicrobia bacterium]|nr:Ig-like domain-containing protein [Candidatus Neomarinimicrobiota bacterium]MBL7023549.1 Ig-like domain-containing protein [Candidatus Neomarinimicrobiota bacterium]MBL7109573.1 Ig-like domain-containing protein [Candidatus Neomarinimicrobiota bacterium]
MKLINHKTGSFLILTFSVMLILRCAALGSPSGGPKDKTAPNIKYIIPNNGTTNIEPNQKITLKFTEMIDPLSVPASIRITPNCDYVVKPRGKSISIYPETIWPENIPIIIQISRRIRDYQKNEMTQPIQLFYSSGDYIPNGIISGKLENINKETITEVGLYNIKNNNPDTLFRKVEISEDGSFSFSYLPNGNYTIVAVENELTDIEQNIHKKRYGMMTYEFINMNDNEEVQNVSIIMQDPIERVEIKSIDLINQDYGTLIFSDGSEEEFVIPWKIQPKATNEDISSQSKNTENNKYQPRDSVTIKLSKQNRLERYSTNSYTFIMPELLDTIPPEIISSSFVDSIFQIKFSEPIVRWKNEDEFKSNNFGFLAHALIDTEYIDILTSYKDPLTLQIPKLPRGTKEIQFFGDSIKDNCNNPMADSLVTVDVNWNQFPKSIIGGDIDGEILNGNSQTIVIEAENIKTHKTFNTITEENYFEFKNLPTGDYTIWAFVQKNTLKNEIYFSGKWTPYQPSADFAIYPELIEVRARWVVEGIQIDFKPNLTE